MTEDREAKTESALKNPERLWVWTWRQGSCGGHSNHADQARAREEHRHAPWNCSTAPVEEYIRADVATAEADERAAGIRDVLTAQLAEARAALEEIAAMQTTKPESGLTEDIGPRDIYADMDDCHGGAAAFGIRQGRFEAAEIARRTLRGGK